MVVVGLGNPGIEYRYTKHNVGYWVVDKLADQFSINFKLGKGEYMHTKGSTVSLVKPLNYMNNSGIALKSYMDYFNIKLEDILIVYDDADLPLGQIKFKSQGSSGGQKGIDSIIYHLKTDNFLRLKVGIATDNSVEPLKSYVLSPFQSKHKTTVALVLDNCVDAINFLLNNTVSETMNKYNKKNKENK
tara:strand:- start:227 stop:790 length:564 start_codon:yes stop_codon:yes gene_type:complete